MHICNRTVEQHFNTEPLVVPNGSDELVISTKFNNAVEALHQIVHHKKMQTKVNIIVCLN